MKSDPKKFIFPGLATKRFKFLADARDEGMIGYPGLFWTDGNAAHTADAELLVDGSWMSGLDCLGRALLPAMATENTIGIYSLR